MKERVELAAEAVLQASGSVGPLELLLEMRLLSPFHFTGWQKGIISTLDDVMQGSPKKLQRSFEHFRQWAQNHGMKPVKAPYLVRSFESFYCFRIGEHMHAVFHQLPSVSSVNDPLVDRLVPTNGFSQGKKPATIDGGCITP